MKESKILFIITAILIGCSNVKNDKEAPALDAINQTQDVTPGLPEEKAEELPPDSTPEETEPFSGITDNFPDFTMDGLTNDSLEAEITNQMAELLQVYDTMQYAKVTSIYAWERPYYVPGQEGDGFMSIENEAETKTWFFDRNNQLRAFSIQSDGTYVQSTLYLFSNDSLVAISERTVDGNYAGVFVDQQRMLASRCPRCGVATSTFEGMANGQVRYLTETDLVAKQQFFFESMPELIQLLNAGRETATRDDYDFIFSINRTKEGNAEHKSKAITYPVTFTVTKELYSNYILKQGLLK